VGGQPALGVPHQFLGGEPAHALHEGAFDLPDVQRRVQAGAHVVQDVGGQHAAFAGQCVDHHLGAGRAVGEVVERPAGQRGLVVVDLGRAVEAVAPELDAVGVGRLHQLVERTGGLGRDHLPPGKADRAGAAAVEPRGEGGQVVAHVAGGELRGATVEVGAAGSGRGAGVGHARGVAGRDLHALEGHAQFVGHDLRHLGVQALAHFGAAMVHHHAAVGVHVHQRAGLVEQRGGKADAELHGRDRQAALEHRAFCVPGGDLRAPYLVLRVCLEPLQQRLQDVVFDRHLVMRDVAVARAVQVAPAHGQRVQAQVARDVAEEGLDRDDALRPAEAAKRGVALGVGLAAIRGDVHIAQEVGVVGVEHRPVGHRPGEIGAEAAIGQHGELQAGDQSAVIETHGVVVGERVALAGDHEVVVAVQPQLDRAAELVRGHGRPNGEVAGLRLLAAEAAAHAPALHTHTVVVDAQRVRHPVLCLARVLGAGIHHPLVLLLRQHVGDLAFQVEVLLAADLEPAAQHMRGARQSGLGVAASHAHRRQHETLRGQRLAHVEHRGQGFDAQAHRACGLARLHHRLGHHQADDAADVLDRVDGEDRLVVGEGGQDGVAGDVLRQHHAAHAGHGQRGGRIDALEAPVGDG